MLNAVARLTVAVLALFAVVAAAAPPPAPPAVVRAAPAGSRGTAEAIVDGVALARLGLHDVLTLQPPGSAPLLGVVTSSGQRDVPGADAVSTRSGTVVDGSRTGWFAAAACGGAVYVNVHMDDGRAWSVRRRAGADRATVDRLDGIAWGPCATLDDEGAAAAVAGAAPLRAAPEIVTGAANDGFCGDPADTVDVLVAYTADAREGQGGEREMQALIALAEATTNLAFANSDVPRRVRIVGTHEVLYVETGNSNVDLDRAVMPDDGWMDDLHVLRDELAADVVSLIVENLSGACGQARFSMTFGLVPHPEVAFHVVAANCAVDRFSFAHELGHNLGCRHNRQADSTPGSFTHSHGQMRPAYGTVMAVSSSPFNRVPHFSHPEIDFDGEATGTKIDSSFSAHNADSITRSTLVAANFRCADCNRNGSADVDDIVFGVSRDCDDNGVPDECDLAAGVADDCDGDGRPDACALADELAFDCNGNGRLDGCDVALGASPDDDGNGIPDECEDCNDNGVPDGVEIAAGLDDCDGDGRPDVCDLPEGDCNGTGVLDACEIATGASIDLDANGVPDECEDCNANGLPDGLELELQLAVDCDANGVLDACDIVAGHLTDADRDGRADECAAIYDETAGTFHASIQLAIDAAVDGAVIGVQPGHYVGSIDPGGKALTVYAPGGAAVTTIDGGSTGGATITCTSGETGATVIDGFTITGGTAGVHCLFSAPTIVRCAIVGNASPTTGGGVRCVQSSPTLMSCLIAANQAQLGAGVYVFNGSPRLINCTIADNGPGAGAAVASINATPWLAGCIVWGNGETAVLGAASMQYSNVQGGWRGPGLGNIDAEPQFIEPLAGDYRLAAGSPCVDAGDNAPLPDEVDRDLDGLPRRVDDPGAADTGNATGEPPIDIGAYERQPS